MNTPTDDFSYLEENVRAAGFSLNDGILVGGLTDAKRLIEKYQSIIGDQTRTIAALNSCIGGVGSTTTENLVGFSRFENYIREDERNKVVELLMSMHRDANGNHNYYHFAANLIDKIGKD